MSHYFKTEREVADCTASLMKSDTAFEHAVPGKKTKIKRMTKKTENKNRKCPTPFCLAESGSETSGKDIITSAQLLRPLPSPALYHALHVEKSPSYIKPSSSDYTTTVTKPIAFVPLHPE